MARTDLPVQEVPVAGVALSFTAANADGHSISNDGKTFLYVKNGSGAPINVTLQTPGTVDGLAVADRVVAVPAGGERIISDLRPDAYNRPPTGTDPNEVYVDFSAVTTVSVAAFR